jgi:hypothetical protein
MFPFKVQLFQGCKSETEPIKTKSVVQHVLSRKQIGRLVYANGWSGGTVVTITLLFTFIMILLTVRLPTHLEQTKSI